MYGGVVIAVINEHGSTDGAPYGNIVTILSYTDPANKAGFEHTYAHLSTVTVNCGDEVAKGDCIGASGTTDAHLHVHLKPFDANGNVPCPWEDEPRRDINSPNTVHSPIASRISGCMDFACFLPANHGGPDITADGLLLSPREAYAYAIPVYTTSEGTTLLSTRVIDGAKLGC